MYQAATIIGEAQIGAFKQTVPPAKNKSNKISFKAFILFTSITPAKRTSDACPYKTEYTLLRGHAANKQQGDT